MAARFEQLLHRDFLRHHIVNIGKEAFLLARVQLDGAKDVGEVEAVDNHAGIVGVGAGANNVHAPRSQHAGHVGKQPRAVACNHRQVEELAVGAQVKLHTDPCRG